MKAYLIFFIVLFKQIQTFIQAQSSVDFVYSSIPYKEYDLKSINGTSSDIKVASSASIAVIAIGQGGLMVIDSSFKSYYIQPSDQSFVQTVQITNDANFIFIGMKEKIGILRVDQKDFSVHMINQIDDPSITIVDIQLSLNEEIMFIIGYLGILQWYDVRNMTNIIQLGQLNYPLMVFYNGHISPNDNLFYIAADQDGLLAFKIDKYLENDNLHVNLTRILRKPAISSMVNFVIQSNNQYVIAIDMWEGIFLLQNLNQLMLVGDNVEDQNESIVNMIMLNITTTSEFLSSIAISSDDKFLYIGARSLGILIYNIQDVLNPQFFQQIQLNGQSFSIGLSPRLNNNNNNKFDNQYIFYSNSLSVYVFRKQQPQLFNQIPNLFNVQQSQMFTQSTSNYKWRCTISQNNNYFLGGFDKDGLCVFKIQVNSYTEQNPSKMQLQYQFDSVLQQIVSTNKLMQFSSPDQIPWGFYVENIYFSKNDQYIYFTSTQYDLNIIAYRFKVIVSDNGEYSFQFDKALVYDQVYYSEQMDLSEDEQHAVMSYQVGIALVDFVKFEVISMYSNSDVIGNFCGAVLSHDKKHALAVARNVGLFIYDTSDMKNPKLVNQWRTSGGETLMRSKTDQIIYLIDGFNGLVLLDSTQLPQIVVIGSFITNGWAKYISFTLDEKYGIISTTDSGTLTLIDLTDKQNLRIIMKSTIQQQTSTTTCVDQTGLSFLFSTNKYGVRLYNLQNQVLIHVEREVLNGADTSLQMKSNENFLIGQSYIIRFTSLYKKQNQIISQIYYYNNLQLKSLPNWIDIDQNQSDPNLQIVLNLVIPKESLDFENDFQSYLILVTQTCLQLDEKSFIFNNEDITTTQNESALIFQFLQHNGYTDRQNCATNLFDSTQQQYLNIQTAFAGISIDPVRFDMIQQYVTETFKRSIILNQFIFNVESSLYFNITNSSQMIFSNVKDVTVSLTLSNNSPFIFVQKIYPSLIIYFNEQLTQMKIQGIAGKNGTYNESQQISVQIIDNVNYDLNLNFNISQQVSFLKLKSDIIQQKSIQDQVNKQYHLAELQIDDQFMIEFDQNTFQDTDSITLTYQILQKINGEYSPLSSDSFIKFDSLNLRIQGTPPSSYLFQTVYLRFQVTNGYTINFQDFYLRIYLMSFTYIFNLLIQILGPLAFAVGFYKQRSIFMNIYFKNKTLYSTETAYVNQIYRKKIAILDQDYSIASLFFQKFLKKIGQSLQKVTVVQKQLQSQVFNRTKTPNLQVNQSMNFSFENRNSSFNTKQQENPVIKVQKTQMFLANESQQACFDKLLLDKKQHDKINLSQNNQDKEQQNLQKSQALKKNKSKKQKNSHHFSQKFSLKQKQIKQQLEMSNDNTSQVKFKQTETIKDQNEQINSNQNQNTSEVEQENDLVNQIFQNSKSKYKESQQLSSKQIRKQKLPNQIFDIQNDNSSQYSHQLNFKKTDTINDQNEQINNIIQNFCLQNVNNSLYGFVQFLVKGTQDSLNLEKLFNIMIQQNLTIQLNMQNYQIQNYAKDLQNENSRFYYCLKAIVVRFLLENEKKTLNAYQQLKKNSIKAGEYLANDWYKDYVEVTATNELDQFGVPLAFSKTTLKNHEIVKQLKLLQMIPNIQNTSLNQFYSIQKYGINPFLLKEVLFADALGLDLVNSKNIVKCYGESLHLKKNELMSVEAFEKIEEGCCLFLRKFFNLQYKSLPISKYVSLPSWLSYDYKNGVIILEGIPTKLDINHYIIRVYDNIRFVCFQYHLIIKDNSYDVDQVQGNTNSVDEFQNQIKKFSQSFEIMNASQSPLLQTKQVIQANQSSFLKEIQSQKIENLVNIAFDQSIKINYSNPSSINIDQKNDEIDEKADYINRSVGELDNKVSSLPHFKYGPQLKIPSFQNTQNPINKNQFEDTKQLSSNQI
ncbi:two component regulator propeller family protein (macronuclear) [Tetrahymena thermophila SB210]|uniref:Two component regulator propeller family protein n=1 Tax=Tetrahymena thermophila (strain SB210) TaxID=312017 RepID=I7MME9_TETTS|nr:two component regulator propeller family protein [Tetrahymena thermophila SB210]EAS04718.2 two component regulator propeller family protein [Tetrahymena thermophila SB210]|eukprot:XP_001024963.2 two component regulator propeller family protein [Tetrahymena thermophila SB210]